MLALGCDNRAVVKVELTNASTTGGGQATPATFALRLNRIYLSEDLTATQEDAGNVSVVWVNRDCAAGSCAYFDLTKSSGEINRVLGAEPQLTRPGTYRYVRLEICNPGAAAPNIEWKTNAMPAPREVTHGWCAVTSRSFDPPLTLDAGEAVTIDLSYDLSSVTSPMPVTTLTASVDARRSFVDCDASAAPQATCLKMPALVPSVKKLP
jgi:hypothetical protein